jgi:galactose mutarotase-like enzyme
LSVTLSSDGFTVEIAELGAELRSLRGADGREYLWNGDPAFWKGRAPILFPIVGMLKDGAYTHEGKRYELPGHGLARTSTFSVTKRGDDTAAFELASSPESRTRFPFDFRLLAEYRARPDGVAVRYQVTNPGTVPLLFSIGSHPGFMVPFDGGSIDEYFVELDQPEKDERFFITKENGLIDPRHVEPVFQDGRRIHLSKSTFDRGAIVLKHPRSRVFRLRSSRSPKSVTMLTEGAPYLGIWAAPGAPYVCLEPWHGIADGTDADGELARKEGIVSLAPGRSFETGYRVTIG